VSAENTELIERWFREVWNAGNVATIRELLADDVVTHIGDQTLRGPSAFEDFHTAYRTAFPDVNVRVEHIVTQGDTVAFRWTATATHTGTLLGRVPTGRRVAFEGMGIVRVDNGKIVEGWNTFDQLGMLQQLGIVKL